MLGLRVTYIVIIVSIKEIVKPEIDIFCLYLLIIMSFQVSMTLCLMWNTKRECESGWGWGPETIKNAS